jgi:DNA-binding transcriptional LysR family regulator
MEVRHLQALVAIADHRTFSAAADHLGTVQSNISAHVARLEQELGAPLVDRANGHLTEEGQVVVARARRVLSELDALVSDVAACKDEVAGTVRVGMIGTTARWLVPQVLEEARRRHPKLRLVVIEGITTGLEPQLANGQLDLAILNLPVPGKDLVAKLLFEEDLVLVVPQDHPLAIRETPVQLAELAELELLLPLPGTAMRDELDAATRPAGITLVPSGEIDGLRLIASLTFEGYGPSILPATAIPRFLRPQFRPVPVVGLPRRRVGVAQRSRGLPSAPTRALLELLEAVVSDPTDLPDGLHLSAHPARPPRSG